LVCSSMTDFTERVKDLQLHGSNAENRVRREEVGDLVHNRWRTECVGRRWVT
jgi:hypothetical protein